MKVLEFDHETSAFPLSEPVINKNTDIIFDEFRWL